MVTPRSSPSGSRQLDWLVLTAANRSQARGYRVELRARRELGALAGAAWDVVADPRGRRLGSGGATLWALFQLARRLLARDAGARSLRELFAGKRVLLIHSGGDSRRLCAYAAQGKIFTPLPCTTRQGRPAALFDLLLERLVGLPGRPGDEGQVLIASGDILLDFDPREVDFDRPGVVGVACSGPLSRGRGHGVYVAGPGGRVVDFLQKPTEAQARSRGALDGLGRVLVDTGLVRLDAPSVERWLRMAGVFLGHGELRLDRGVLEDLVENGASPIDLYQEMLMAMLPSLERGEYVRSLNGLASRSSSGERRRLSRMYRWLHGQEFHVHVLSRCEFLHMGTHRDLLETVTRPGPAPTARGFENFTRSAVADPSSLDGALVYNSLLESPQTRAGDEVVIESVHTDRPVQLDGENIVVGWPAAARRKLELARGWGLVCLPLRDGSWSAVLFGIHDDFKSSRRDGGTFGNEPIEAFLARHGLSARELWREGRPEDQSLWNARLWCVGPLRDVLRMTLPLGNGCRSLPPAWRGARRVSLARLLARVDHERLAAHRREVQRVVAVRGLATRLAADAWLAAGEVVRDLSSVEEARRALDDIARLIDEESRPLRRARYHELAHQVLRAFPSARRRSRKGTGKGDLADPRQTALAEVARAVAGEPVPPGEAPRAAILPDQVVWVTTPVRIDFSGCWSDTPPICHEMGGAVLNAAVTLNRQYPIQVMVKLADEPVITLNSIDLARRVELDDANEILRYTDPGEWAALPKAALVLSGICPSAPGPGDGKRLLRNRLERFGGGLHLTIFAALPKGSGLGTSSVLGAATLAALARVTGERPSREELFRRTSVLEQMMTTGGGWQDQIGGITPGVKLIRTRPGIQEPSLHWSLLDPSCTEEMRSRCLLYYTGYRRMARDILQNVVHRFLGRDPELVSLVEQLKRGAESAKEALDRGDLDGLGHAVEEYWALKKRMDSGATNANIEKLIGRVRRHLIGQVLPGAGGGGFLFMVAGDGASAAKVRRMLERNPPNRQARFFDFEIDDAGLEVKVL